jgi:hypothetical protein
MFAHHQGWLDLCSNDNGDSAKGFHADAALPWKELMHAMHRGAFEQRVHLAARRSLRRLN